MSFELLYQNFKQSTELMSDILAYTIFISDESENIEYSVNYVRSLHKLIQTEILKLDADNAAKSIPVLSLLFD